MGKRKKLIITIAALLIIAVAVFAYFRIPGRAINEIADLRTADWVQVRQTTVTQTLADDGTGMRVDSAFTHTEYVLNAEQIEMLKAFILDNSFTRTFRGRTLITPVSSNRFTITAGFSDGVGPSSVLYIDIASNGYFMLDQFRSWIRINNPDWEAEILKILEFS
ncbi:MAG: hypothetical protein FWC90_06535 [Oscillospiraceae bacterium]|nr:hypothetical protein [Oscillospiraceae bacterium]